MNALESAQHGDSDNCIDPYTQVVPEVKRKSRGRLVGSCVTKKDLKKKDSTKSGLILPEEMKADIVQQLVPSVAAVILSQLQAANPGMNIVIPSLSGDMSSAPHHDSEQNRQSSDFGATADEVISTKTI